MTESEREREREREREKNNPGINQKRERERERERVEGVCLGDGREVGLFGWIRSSWVSLEVEWVRFVWLSMRKPFFYFFISDVGFY